jgi:hypothetical protein
MAKLTLGLSGTGHHAANLRQGPQGAPMGFAQVWGFAPAWGFAQACEKGRLYRLGRPILSLRRAAR